MAGQRGGMEVVMISHHERHQCVHTTTEQVRCVQRESGVTRSRDRDGGQLGGNRNCV
jgi:hypothetical protein